MLVKTKNIRIGYNNHQQQSVLSDINLDIDFGKLIALVGTNGIGKSTLLKTIAGILQTLAGEIEIVGKNTNTFTPADWAKSVSMVLTQPDIYQNMSVKELIALGRQPHTNWIGALQDKDEQIILQAMQITQTQAWAKKNVDELSDGQKQKVFIARAIAQDTPLILMDEPTTHLDFYNKIEFQKLVKKLTKTGKTILYSTHDLDLAIQHCDELIVLSNNKVHHQTPQKLIDNKVFDNFFDSDDIWFDAQHQRFVMK